MIEAALVAFSNHASSAAAVHPVPSSSAEPAAADRLEAELTSHLEQVRRPRALSAPRAPAGVRTRPHERRVPARTLCPSWCHIFAPQLAELNEAMSRHASGPGTISLHTLQRHREIMHDYTAEFQKTRASIKAARERASLLDTVRSDIRDFRNAAQPASGRAGDASLLRERNALHHSIRLADEVIGRAQSTQGSLSEQRGMLGDIGRKVVGLGSQLPVVGKLIGAIGARKRRDVVVLGGTAGICLVLLIWATLL